MMIRKFVLLGLSTLPLLLGTVGCERKSVSRPYMIQCGKVAFSRSMADHLVEARVALALFQQPGLDKRRQEALRRDVASNVVSKLKQDFVVTNCLNQMGVVISRDLVERRFCQVFKSKKRSDAFLAKQAPDIQFFIRDLVRADVAFETLRNRVLTNAVIRVPEDKVRAAVERIAHYNAIALATNAVIYAQASNCWHEIKSGRLSFLKASLKYDKSLEQSDSRAYWGEFPLSALSEDSDLCRMVSAMKPGDVTPPVEADNCLCVVQLIEVVQNDKKGAVLAPEAYYRLNKISFELPIIYEKPTFDNVRAELQDQEKSRYFSDFMKREYERFDF